MSIEIAADFANGFEVTLQQARLLMKGPASVGGDTVKYQLVKANDLATKHCKYYDFLKSLEIADDIFFDLSNYANKLGINLPLDILGPHSLKLAETIRVSSIKIYETDIANIGLLIKVSESFIPKNLLGSSKKMFK